MSLDLFLPISHSLLLIHATLFLSAESDDDHEELLAAAAAARKASCIDLFFDYLKSYFAMSLDLVSIHFLIDYMFKH